MEQGGSFQRTSPIMKQRHSPRPEGRPKHQGSKILCRSMPHQGLRLVFCLVVRRTHLRKKANQTCTRIFSMGHNKSRRCDVPLKGNARPARSSTDSEHVNRRTAGTRFAQMFDVQREKYRLAKQLTLSARKIRKLLSTEARLTNASVLQENYLFPYELFVNSRDENA